VNAHISFRRHRALSIAVVAFLFLATSQHALATGRQAQQTSQAPPQASEPQKTPQPSSQPPDPSAPKQKKVWTNDDMPTLRTPADTYVEEKEAQEAAAAEAASKRAELEKQIKQAGLTIDLPPTAGETQRLIKSKQERVQELKDHLMVLTQSLPDAPEDLKAANQKQIEEFTGESQRLQMEIKVLQDHLQSLAKTPASEPPSAPSTPPSAPSTPPSPEKPL
jgi:hypothetical protein